MKPLPHDRLAAPLLFLACVFAFWPALHGTHLLSDDLVWTRNGGMSFTQVFNLFQDSGRPLAGIVAGLTAKCPTRLDAVHFIHALSVLALSWSAILIYRWLVFSRVKRFVAFGVAILAITLPAFQVFANQISAWMGSLGTICAIGALMLTHRAKKKRHYFYAALLILASLTLDQQTALIYFSLMIVPLLMARPDDFEQRWKKPIFIDALLFFTVVAFYFSIWRIYPSNGLLLRWNSIPVIEIIFACVALCLGGISDWKKGSLREWATKFFVLTWIFTLSFFPGLTFSHVQDLNHLAGFGMTAVFCVFIQLNRFLEWADLRIHAQN